MSISKIKKSAESLLSQLSSGKEYTTKYVFDRLATAAEKHPKDILINTMRDVMYKKASNQLFISQSEISDLYNSLYNYSGSYSAFRNEMSDLLPSKFAQGTPSKKDASGSRFDMGKTLEPLQRDDLNKMAQEFAGVFSLAPKGSFSQLDNNSYKKAEKFTSVQLKSIGCEPKYVRAVKANDHFILCVASYQTPGAGEVSLKVPVQMSGATPTLPTHFIDESNLEKLSQQNVLVYLKQQETEAANKVTTKVAENRISSEIQIDRLDRASNLEKWANLEQELIEATTKYDRNTVRLATSILDSELKSMDLVNPQVKVASSYNNGLNYEISFGSPRGRINADLKMEIVSGQPIPPLKFSCQNTEYEFSKRGFETINRSIKTASTINTVAEDMERMDYNQLINIMIKSANVSDFKTSEDVLSVIQTKYSGQQVVNALNKYSSLLKHNSKNAEREALIKEAVRKGELIKTPNSFDLYSPQYGMPLSKLAFDASGKLIPKYRYQNENLKESEEMNIMTSQIKLT